MILSILFFFFFLIEASLLNHEFYVIQLSKSIWDKPNISKEVLRSLERDHKVKFWAGMNEAQFIVSFDKYARSSRNHRNLESGFTFDIKEKPYVQSHFLKAPKKIRIVTCIENVDIRSFFSYDTQNLFTVQYDSSLHTNNNIAIISFNKPEIYGLQIIEVLNNKPSIISIEEVKQIKLHNFHALHTSLAGKDTNHFIEPGIIKEYGSGTIITIGDTGLDLKHCFFNHPDFTVTKQYISRSTSKSVLSHLQQSNPQHPKILAYFAVVYEEDGKQYRTDFEDSFSGHGTHVAGSAVGGNLNPFCIPSIFPEFSSKAKLIFFDFMNNPSSINSTKKQDESLLVPPSLTWIMETSYNLGSRIFTNSWGSDGNGYSFYSHQIDHFVYMNPDYVVLFSNGNDGPDLGTVGNPATMKNGISVGSSLNSRLSFMEYSNKRYWNDQTFNFTANIAIQTDLYCNENSLSAFSSRGPTYDGRIKPDLVFPGEFILSAQSIPLHNHQEQELTLKRGTSMATPLVASMLSIVEERLKKIYHQIQPSASLKKSILLTSTKLLSNQSVDFHFDHNLGFIKPTNIPITTSKYNHQGFGRLVLTDFLNDQIGFQDNIEIFGFSKPILYCFQSPNITSEFIFTLVYTDVPSIGYFSNQTLVNDLNIRLIIQQNDAIQKIFNGNHDNKMDNKNNVEQIRFNTIPGNIYRIIISTHGPIISLRPDKVQRLLFSISFSKLAKSIPCKQECTSFDLPYECMLENGDIGEYLCIDGKYENKCTPIQSSLFLCSPISYIQNCPIQNSTCNCTDIFTGSTNILRTPNRSLDSVLLDANTKYIPITSTSHRVPILLHIFISCATVFIIVLLSLHLKYTRRRIF